MRQEERRNLDLILIKNEIENYLDNIHDQENLSSLHERLSEYIETWCKR